MSSAAWGECPIAVLKQSYGRINDLIIAGPHGGMPYCGIEARLAANSLIIFACRMGECPIAVLKLLEKLLSSDFFSEPHGGMPYCGIEANHSSPSEIPP